MNLGRCFHKFSSSFLLVIAYWHHITQLFSGVAEVMLEHLSILFVADVEYFNLTEILPLYR